MTTIMTKDEMFKKWMEALRSGEYKQVQGTLMGKTPEGEVGYCCLGVFNDLFKVGSMYEVDFNQIEDEDLDAGPEDTYAAIRKSLSLDNDGCTGVPVVEAGIEMNDNGNSFTEIADALEKLWDDKD